MRKFFCLLRTLLIGVIWTYIFLALSGLLFIRLWNFNFLAPSGWRTISDFWQVGGVIKTSRDYLFLLMLAAVPGVWLWGWRRLLRIGYFNLLLSPVNRYNRYVINKYGHNSKRIVLKNLKSSQKMIDDIKNQLESIKPESPKEVKNIREEIQKKIESGTSKF